MNKNAFLTASICIFFAITGKTYAANPPQPIDATTAQAYIANYKNNVTNKFAESYTLDLTAIANLVTNGATAVRMYNGLMGDASKTAIMVPLDANMANMTGGTQMFSYGHGICPPDCDVTKSVSASMMSTPNAQSAANGYNTNGTFDNFNAFIIYPQAITALKTGGAVTIQVCNAKTPQPVRAV